MHHGETLGNHPPPVSLSEDQVNSTFYHFHLLCNHVSVVEAYLTVGMMAYPIHTTESRNQVIIIKPQNKNLVWYETINMS